MTDLRVVLLVAGALILVLIWLLEIRRERHARRQRTVMRQRTTPGYRDDRSAPPPAAEGEAPEHAPALPPMSPTGEVVQTGHEPAPAPAEFIAVHVHAAGQSRFDLNTVFSAAESAGLVFGDRQIFHMPGMNSGSAPLFSVANMLEPGTFSRDAGSRPTRGLTLFMRLPAETDAVMVLDLLLHTADLLAIGLGGVVHGMDHRPLTPERIAALRQKAAGRKS